MGLVVISGSPFHWECSPLGSHLCWQGVQGTCRAPDLCILWFPVHDTRQQKLKFIWFNKWPQSKSQLHALSTLLSSFFYLVFWPESLLLSCQLITLRKIYFPAFLVFFSSVRGLIHQLSGIKLLLSNLFHYKDISKITIKFSVTAEYSHNSYRDQRGFKQKLFCQYSTREIQLLALSPLLLKH